MSVTHWFKITIRGKRLTATLSLPGERTDFMDNAELIDMAVAEMLDIETKISVSYDAKKTNKENE